MNSRQKELIKFLNSQQIYPHRDIQELLHLAQLGLRKLQEFAITNDSFKLIEALNNAEEGVSKASMLYSSMLNIKWMIQADPNLNGSFAEFQTILENVAKTKTAFENSKNRRTQALEAIGEPYVYVS